MLTISLSKNMDYKVNFGLFWMYSIYLYLWYIFIFIYFCSKILFCSKIISFSLYLVKLIIGGKLFYRISKYFFCIIFSIFLERSILIKIDLIQQIRISMIYCSIMDSLLLIKFSTFHLIQNKFK